ncbi:MAG: S8 family serine peptidase [Bacteroidota bacterium]
MIRLILILILSVSFAASQQLVVRSNGVTKNIPTATGITASSVDNAVVTSPSENELIRVIVQLKEPSRIEQRRMGKVYTRTVSARTKQRILTADSETRIINEFENVLNGFTISARREKITSIAAMPEVRSVFPDVNVSVTPVSQQSSTPVIPTGTSTATAKGIRIGIIDTGIDYLHEAFGGAFGEGHTAAGGYDLVNNDPDPMDDNGHGSHVAGIISGRSSTITGIAKDAELYIYKALDQNGNGSSSNVIAAIERAVKDSVKVLNLSLGTPSGSSDDPLSIAVNNAVQAGVVVVVAAGNTGDYSSINSPGTAEFALTVGATDANSIASFSSKGPETESYRIKPEVVAPGVSILSVKSGGGYVEMSGTSMATPYVTSLAAAMRELHPDWSAFQIRDAIISNTIDLGKPVFSQGHGKVNESVLNCTLFSSPSDLSFGFNPPSASTWKQQRSITLYNKSTTPKRYSFSSSTTNAAMKFIFTPAQTDIPANGSVTVQIDLETNNLFLSNNSAFESGYSGKIIAAGSSDSITVPFAFFKGPILQLHFNEVPWLVMVHNGSSYSKTFSPKVNSMSMIVKDGLYDVVTSFYGSRYVVTERINVSGRSGIEINSSEAQFPVSFQPISENGSVIDLGKVGGTCSYLEALVYQPAGYAVVGMGGGKTNSYSNRPKYFSAMSKNYAYGYSITLQPNNLTSYTYDVIVDSGITAERNFTFQPSELKHIDVKYTLDAGVQRAFPITWTNFIGKYSSLAVTFYDGNTTPLTYPFTQNAYYIERIKKFPIFHQREAYSF